MTVRVETLDLGHGVTYRYMIGRYGDTIGIVETHTVPRKKRICGTRFILFDIPEAKERFPGKPVWAVHSEVGQPLTLWPSILCSTCGGHGFISNGKWVPDD